LVKCGKTRTIGVAAPITGPAGSLGQQQLHWAQYFVTRYNRSHKNKLQIVQGDTQLPDTAQAIQVAERLVFELEHPRSRGPGGQPGGSGIDGTVEGRRARLHHWLVHQDDADDRRNA